ncbi:DUF2332 domain-containing protein [Ilumatobacter sp.]|uniref:DUF2332 domain-containing protein n=1 Tax=Ilumatobacter sp. TaxID=1967498 RepID=UPI003C511594
MRDPWNDSELVRRFREHARTSMPRAPLNAALCTAIADDRALSSMLGHAPALQQLPVLLLAAIHDAVLRDREHPIAAWYPNLTTEARDPLDADLATVLAGFVDERSPLILETLGSRRVQTNEVGRCALFLPSFGRVADEVGPVVHIDVGSSAGLTTLLPHYSYRYDDGELIGSGTPLIACDTRSEATVTYPIPHSIPTVADSCGIDLDPLDPTDPDDARWLQACCWPDQTDRFDRLAAALEVARHHPPRMIRGDAVELVRPTVDELRPSGHPIVTTSWVLNYLDPSQRRDFQDQLDEFGRTGDLTWVFAESPALTPELPHDADLAGEHTTALTVVTWRSGRRQVEPLGVCHPHGYWIHWG